MKVNFLTKKRRKILSCAAVLFLVFYKNFFFDAFSHLEAKEINLETHHSQTQELSLLMFKVFDLKMFNIRVTISLPWYVVVTTFSKSTFVLENDFN